MRDRLIELIGEARAMEASGIEFKVSDGYIADHLIAEGVIVPKVKIGDKLYELSASKTKFYEVTVTHLEVRENDIRIWGEKPKWQATEWICSQSDLGNNEWVFTTEEEAEKALKERSNENAE